MKVLIVSECSGGARLRSQRQLDEFLPRIGSRTWFGTITAEGLQRLRGTIAKAATKNTSVICRIMRGPSSSDKAWIVGNRERLSSNWQCSVATSEKSSPPERLASNTEALLSAVASLSALFHDLGKMTVWFQQKLRKSGVDSMSRDPIRHEVVSCMVIRAMVQAFPSEADMLSALSNHENVPEIMKSAFQRAFSRPEATLGKTWAGFLNGSIDDLCFPIGPAGANEKIEMVLAAVLTHHRLPGGTMPLRGRGMVPLLSCRNNLVHKPSILAADASSKRAMNELFKLPDLVPIWADQNYVRDVSDAARSLLLAEVSDPEKEFKAVTVLVRTALILGDHKASEIGNTSYPSDSKPTVEGLAYANTSSKVRGALAEPLASHLSRVYRETRKAFDILAYKPMDFPSIALDELPEAVGRPRADAASKFRWQVDARKATRKALKSAGHGAGFFGILMAGTGSGKTRAGAIIMAAGAMPERQGLRMSVLSGLRALTLQGGLEYQRDLGFARSDVGIVIGDSLTSELFDLTVSAHEFAAGTEADHMVEDLVAQADLGIPDRPLPPHAQRLLGKDITAAPAMLNAVPVLVSTIDTLMRASESRRGGHTPQMMRVATSDLIIDEIDDFDGEDICAISRLVFLSGFYGRRTLIASATLSPIIANVLHSSYRSGWEHHCRIRGLESPVVCGWYSDLNGSRCAVVPNNDSFSVVHDEFARESSERLRDAPPKRKLEVATIGEASSPSELYSEIDRHIQTQHRHHHVSDPITGKKLSVGVVRWSNVRPSMGHARYLTLSDHAGCTLRVVPYNGTLLPVYRHYLEERLNPMLSRKNKDGVDPILANPIVRALLDDPACEENAIVVVVTTSMEEVGRDHDFDWVITEPGSGRGLVQISGRCLRHREVIPTAANVMVLERCLRDICRPSNGRTKPFSFPGVETPIFGVSPDEMERSGILLEHHHASDVYDVAGLEKAIDAREIIAPGEPRSKIAGKERLRLSILLSQGTAKNVKWTVPSMLDDPCSFLTVRYLDERRFRRQNGRSLSLFFETGTVHENGWKVLDAQTGKPYPCDSYIKSVDLDETKLLFPFGDEHGATQQLATRLWPGEDGVPKWKIRTLSMIERTTWGNSPMSDFRYNRHLGMTESSDKDGSYFF